MDSNDQHVQQAHRGGCSHGAPSPCSPVGSVRDSRPGGAGRLQGCSHGAPSPCLGERHGRPGGAGRLQKQNPAFTLVELLLVVAIIALLMGLLLAGIVKARRQGEFQRARVEVQSLYNAFRSYYADYGQYPYTDEAVRAVDSTLVGMLSGGSGLGNTKQRIYLPIKTGQTNSAGALVDPWGNTYRVLFDGIGSAADGVLANPFGPVGYSNRVPFMVWSNGPDGQSDTGGEISDKNKDNIKSY